LKLHDVPEGRPLHDRLMACNGPLTPITVIVLELDEPWLAVIPPEFERKKSKPAVEVVTVLLTTLLVVVLLLDVVPVGMAVVRVAVENSVVV